jgi:hypothetical protein
MLSIERNIPFPKKQSKELVNFLISLNDGDSVFLNYEDFNKTVVNNSIACARIRILSKGLSIRTVGQSNGRRVWAFKRNL